MSIAGRRLPTHYVSRDDLPGPDGHFPEPEVNVTLRMEHATAAYLCGHQKSGLERLQTFTGARFKVGYDTVDIRGLPEQVELARFCIDITLQQRRESRAGPLRFEEIERRPDVSTLDVPVETVGYVLGTRGASLRKHEAQNHVFMFFDNDRIRPGGPQGVRTKRLYIEQVSRAVEAHAKAALPALFEAHRLCWDEAAVGKMLCAAASQIHASVAGRGETSYRVALPDGRPHTVRLAALDRYLRKVVQARAERLAGAI